MFYSFHVLFAIVFFCFYFCVSNFTMMGFENVVLRMNVNGSGDFLDYS